jgi:hypothetical protein
MKWSRTKQQMVLKLQEIERARKRAAEARLLEARAAVDQAELATSEAERELHIAELSWTGHLKSARFNVELGQALGAQLLQQQRVLDRHQDRERTEKHKLDDQMEAWRKIEASVRSADKNLGWARRALVKRAEASRDQELAERTTWKWFHR